MGEPVHVRQSRGSSEQVTVAATAAVGLGSSNVSALEDPPSETCSEASSKQLVTIEEEPSAMDGSVPVPPPRRKKKKKGEEGTESAACLTALMRSQVPCYFHHTSTPIVSLLGLT